MTREVTDILTETDMHTIIRLLDGFEEDSNEYVKEGKLDADHRMTRWVADMRRLFTSFVKNHDELYNVNVLSKMDMQLLIEMLEMLEMSCTLDELEGLEVSDERKQLLPRARHIRQILARSMERA